MLHQRGLTRARFDMAITDDDSLRAWLRLALEPGLTPSEKRALLGHAGLPEQVYDLGVGQLAKMLEPNLARQLAAPPTPELADAIEATCEWLSQPGNHIITLADPEYPAGLLEIHDPPIVLYVIGEVACLARPCIAVVGARSATPGGRDNAYAFARHLAGAGWCVVSGLAAGIDAAAHEGALAASPVGAGTIAVIATGPDLVYPARHRDLAHRIAAGGAIVTELPLGTRAIRYQFPKRNRLVAGLSRGVLVVEAALQSGSLITARLAAELGREVFAIPGSIHSPLSRGCHALIRQGAKLTETAADILSELGEVSLRDAGLIQPPTKAEQGSYPIPKANSTAKMPSPASGESHGALDRSKPDATHLCAVNPAPSECLASRDAHPTKTSGREPPAEPVVSGPHPQEGQVAAILEALGYDPVHIDDLQRRVQLPMPALHTVLLELELDGVVVRLEGGRYERRHQ